jgi:hypothetical protein
MTTPLLIDGRMQLSHPTWVLGTFPNFTLACTKAHYCPSFTLTNELVKKGGTNNNLHFLLVDFPHVHTAETADDPNSRLSNVSDDWKPPLSAPALPTPFSTICTLHFVTFWSLLLCVVCLLCIALYFPCLCVPYFLNVACLVPAMCLPLFLWLHRRVC